MTRIALLAAASLSLVACGDDDDDDADTTAPDTTSVPATTAPAEGITFTSPDGDFSVLLPAEPEESTQDVALPDGTTAPLTAWQTLLGDEGAYTVARLTFPAGIVLDPAAALPDAQEQALAAVGATLTSEEAIDLDGIPGREFTGAVTQGGLEGTLVQRIYLSGNTLYQINFVGQGERAVTDPELAPFFESFTITPT